MSPILYLRIQRGMVLFALSIALGEPIHAQVPNAPRFRIAKAEQPHVLSARSAAMGKSIIDGIDCLALALPTPDRSGHGISFFVQSTCPKSSNSYEEVAREFMEKI